eukprot:scaffold12050_cov168-Amphora_coffeaeformis.AAC.3
MTRDVYPFDRGVVLYPTISLAITFSSSSYPFCCLSSFYHIGEGTHQYHGTGTGTGTGTRNSISQVSSMVTSSSSSSPFSQRRAFILAWLASMIIYTMHQAHTIVTGFSPQTRMFNGDEIQEQSATVHQHTSNPDVSNQPKSEILPPIPPDDAEPKNHIRRWGCNRTEASFIFIHVGKAGGGNVRPRLAAAALGYNRTRWHISKDPTAYYNIPIYGHDGDVKYEKAHFCNSGSPNFFVNSTFKTFEGTQSCHAVTPLGHAVACPLHLQHSESMCMGCRVEDAHCHRVYVGHNFMGNEMHWLPPAVLDRWWKSQQESEDTSDWEATWRLLERDNKQWCPKMNLPRPRNKREQKGMYKDCSIPLARRVDTMANEWMRKQARIQQPKRNTALHDSLTDIMDPTINWGPLYASLPVLRVTQVRDPFAWMLSKFYWHADKQYHNCTNITAAVHWQDTRVLQMDETTSVVEAGWAHRYARHWILHMCGEDCQSRMEQARMHLGDDYTADHERMLLETFERQADYNLRQSIAVVGQSEETDNFYDLISARVHYLDMSRNSHVQGKRHSSNAKPYCREAFADPTFQQALIEASPAVAAFVRLYKTALKVNAFQKEELAACAR